MVEEEGDIFLEAIRLIKVTHSGVPEGAAWEYYKSDPTLGVRLTRYLTGESWVPCHIYGAMPHYIAGDKLRFYQRITWVGAHGIKGTPVPERLTSHPFSGGGEEELLAWLDELVGMNLGSEAEADLRYLREKVQVLIHECSVP